MAQSLGVQSWSTSLTDPRLPTPESALHSPYLDVRVAQRHLPLVLHTRHGPRVGVVIGPPAVQHFCVMR